MLIQHLETLQVERMKTVTKLYIATACLCLATGVLVDLRFWGTAFAAGTLGLFGLFLSGPIADMIDHQE